MDPTNIDTWAQSLPNLMSMISLYLQGRQQRKDATKQEFLEWLEAHRFEEIKRIILETHGLEREIDTLLQTQQSEILGKLAVISESVSLIASRMELFQGVSQIVANKITLSDQALWMLHKLNKAEDYYPYMNIMTYSGGILLSIGALTYKPKAPRHVREDFNDLGRVGFVSLHKHNDRGEPVLGITRLGEAYVKTLPEPPPDDVPGEQLG